MKNTQGPLTVAPHSNPTIGSDWREIHAENGIYEPIYVGEAQEADAVLFAAAPELLAALELLMSDPSRKSLLPETVLSARSAIAKATGR
tara:strand:+ start:755 stop:1021 length:267 start_codon:yes stop_codon:yes gene_type:complete